MIETRLFGKYRSLVPNSCATEDTILMCDYKEGESFEMFVKRLNLDITDMGNCFINGKLANNYSTLSDGDRVALFPIGMQFFANVSQIQRLNKHVEESSK